MSAEVINITLVTPSFRAPYYKAEVVLKQLRERPRRYRVSGPIGVDFEKIAEDIDELGLLKREVWLVDNPVDILDKIVTIQSKHSKMGVKTRRIWF